MILTNMTNLLIKSSNRMLFGIIEVTLVTIDLQNICDTRTFYYDFNCCLVTWLVIISEGTVQVKKITTAGAKSLHNKFIKKIRYF